MSSTPSGEQEQKRPAGPPPERKAAAGPVITPQVLAIAFGIILVIGLVVYYQTVIVKFNRELTDTTTAINAAEQRIQTYQTKIAKLDQATEVNRALREKLNLIDYLFLYNQDSVLPFFQDTLFPIIESSRMTLVPGTSVVEVEQYTFKINMAMQPFETLPRTMWFEDAADLFPIDYDGEKNGQPIDTPLNTQPGTFLEPYNINLISFYGTYEDVQTFIEDLQTAKDDILITVHCLKNEVGENAGLYRTTTAWNIALTVYFMNPEASAQGDNPPDPPGAHTC